jgi:hypothetical protein
MLSFDRGHFLLLLCVKRRWIWKMGTKPCIYMYKYKLASSNCSHDHALSAIGIAKLVQCIDVYILRNILSNFHFTALYYALPVRLKNVPTKCTPKFQSFE